MFLIAMWINIVLFRGWTLPSERKSGSFCLGAMKWGLQWLTESSFDRLAGA